MVYNERLISLNFNLELVNGREKVTTEEKRVLEEDETSCSRVEIKCLVVTMLWEVYSVSVNYCLLNGYAFIYFKPL